MSDKELIKQEIERLINDKTDGKHVAKADITAPKRSAYLDILNFIDSLPEEPASENKSEKELSETYLATFDKKYPILPTLKGKQKADFKNFLNKCQQEFGLKEFGIHPTQSKLFEKLTLLWATWGAEHLGGLGESNEYEFDKEHISEDLEEEIDNYFKDWTFDDEMSVMVKPNHYFAEFNDIKEIARHFAEWQKEKYNKQFGFFNLKDCKDAYNEWKSTQDEPSVALAWIRACEWQKQQMMKDAVEGEIVYQVGSAEIAPTDIRYKVVSDRVYIPNVKLGDKVKIIIVKED